MVWAGSYLWSSAASALREIQVENLYTPVERNEWTYAYAECSEQNVPASSPVFRMPVSGAKHTAVVAERDEARKLCEKLFAEARIIRQMLNDSDRLYLDMVQTAHVLRIERDAALANTAKIHTHRDSGGRFAKVQS